MGTYLMMLYVSLEQELAVKDLFTNRGWGFRKPDLRLTTDDVGPLTDQLVPECNNIRNFAEQDQDQNMLDETGQAATADGTNLSEFEPFIRQLMPVSKPDIGISNMKKQAKQQTSKIHVTVSQNTAVFGQAANETEDVASETDEAGNQNDGELGSVVKVKVEQSSDDYVNTDSYVANQTQYDDDYDDRKQFDQRNDETDIEPIATTSQEAAIIETSTTEAPTKPNKRKKADQGPVKGGIYRCEKCYKSYERPSSLRSHKLKHSEVRPFQCSVCGKTFVFKDSLNQHLITHSSIANEVCPFCGKKFKHRSSLCKHLRLHGPSKYACDTCGKGFTRREYFEAHAKTHGDKDQCGKCKVYVFHLDKHVCKADRGQPVFPCTVCGKKFRHKRYLCEHTKYVHTLAGSFSCPHCGRIFNHRSSLHNHKKFCEEGEGKTETEM